MEFDVLEGAKQTIVENRPRMYVEVSNESVHRFEDWVRHNNYKIIGGARLVSGIKFFAGPV